jgi:hypothetical protein
MILLFAPFANTILLKGSENLDYSFAGTVYALGACNDSITLRLINNA